MAQRIIWDGTAPFGVEVTNGPGPAPTSAVILVVRRCEGCGTRALSDGHTLDRDGWYGTKLDGRDTGQYWCGRCGACWADVEAAA